MKFALKVFDDFIDDPRAQKEINEASTALRQAIAEAEKQEPVAWTSVWALDNSCNIDFDVEKISTLPIGTPLYTQLPKREWVGLTNEEKRQILLDDPLDWINAIEQALKEKNT